MENFIQIEYFCGEFCVTTPYSEEYFEIYQDAVDYAKEENLQTGLPIFDEIGSMADQMFLERIGE